MSYKGYEQIICRCGTYLTRDCHDNSCCTGCNRNEFTDPEDFVNSVDTTNCESYGYIPLDVLDEHFCIEKEVVKTCNMEHDHIVKNGKYRIPTKEEAAPLRTFWDNVGGRRAFCDDPKRDPSKLFHFDLPEIEESDCHIDDDPFSSV